MLEETVREWRPPSRGWSKARERIAEGRIVECGTAAEILARSTRTVESQPSHGDARPWGRDGHRPVTPLVIPRRGLVDGETAMFERASPRPLT